MKSVMPYQSNFQADLMLYENSTLLSCNACMAKMLINYRSFMSTKSYMLLFKFKWSIFTVFLLSTEPSAASMHHVGHKFHEVFQLKQGRFSDLSAAKISEMMKSNSLDVSFHLYNLNGHSCFLMLEFSH